MNKRRRKRFLKTTRVHLMVLLIVLSPVLIPNQGLGVSKKPHGGKGTTQETNKKKKKLSTQKKGKLNVN